FEGHPTHDARVDGVVKESLALFAIPGRGNPRGWGVVTRRRGQREYADASDDRGAPPVRSRRAPTRPVHAPPDQGASSPACTVVSILTGSSDRQAELAALGDAIAACRRCEVQGYLARA